MKRKEWLLGTASTEYLRAQLLKQDCKSILHDVNTAIKTIAVLSDMADTWKRERILCVPFSEKKFISQLQERRIEYCRSEQVFGAFLCDFRQLSEKTWEHLERMIARFLPSESVKTDSDIKYGATGQLSPTPQKIRGAR